MALNSIILQGYRLNGDWVHVLSVDRLFYKNDMIPTPRRPLCLLRVLIDAKRNGDGYVTNSEFLRLAFAGVTVSAAAVFPNIRILRERFGDEAIPYHRPRGYILNMTLEELDHVPEGVVELPDYPDELLARAGELEKGLDLIAQNRFVAITGTGGIGKTRLAVALARLASPHFPDGVRLVDLAPVKGMTTLAGAIAVALKVPLLAGDSPVETIANAIDERKILLVADTCEYLVKQAGGFFEELLARAPNLSLLATTQRRFGLRQEKTLLLKGLAVPPLDATAERKGAAARIGEVGAVALFVRRAQSSGDGFVLADGNAADIAEICRQLGGHPLSIELAAARVPFFGAVELRNSLGEALSILNGGPEGSAPRHLSLREMIDWSHGLLDDAQQRVFRRLGIFPASFTVTGARTVTGEDPSVTIRLSEHSMLRLEEHEPGETPRYRLHESQLLYARERLKDSGEYDEIAERFARHLMDMLLRAAAEWETTPDTEWLNRFGWILDNLGAALNWAFADSTRDTFAIDLAGLSARLFDLSGRVIEGRRHVDRAKKLIGSDTPPASAARLLVAASLLWRLEDRLGAVAMLKQAATLYREIGDRENLGIVLASIGSDCTYLGRVDEATTNLAEANEICALTSNMKILHNITNSLGLLAMNAGDADEAELCFAKALNYAQAAENVLRVNLSIANLAEVDFFRGQIDSAIQRAREAADGFRANFLFWLPWVLVNLASYLMVRGDHAEARAVAEEALLLLREQRGHWRTRGLLLWALIAALEGQYTKAARLLGYINTTIARTGETLEFTEKQIYDMLMKILLENCSPEQIRTYGVEGSVWSMDRAVEFTLRHIVPPTA